MIFIGLYSVILCLSAAAVSYGLILLARRRAQLGLPLLHGGWPAVRVSALVWTATIAYAMAQPKPTMWKADAFDF